MLSINGQNSMRLLYVTNARMPTEKAHGLQIVKTVEALQKQGIEVRLLVPSRKNHIKTNLKAFYNLKSEIDVVYVFDVVRLVQYLSEKIYFPLQRLWFGIVAFVYALQWRGVIYSRDITISFFLSMFGKQIIYEDHEPKQRFRRSYEFFLRYISKKVIVAQNLISDYREMRIPEQSYVAAPNGVDIEEFNQVLDDKEIWSKELGITNYKPVVLYVGHFYTWKGVYTLLDAAKEIHANVVLVGGTKEDYRTIGGYIKEHEIQNVYIHEFVPHHEIITYIKSADVLVLPNTAREERSQKYTTPIKLFEYMISGVPIVSSNVQSFSHYLKNESNAILCEPDNPQALAHSINKVLDNKELANKISTEAKDEVRQYDWNNRVEKIVNFIYK
jgi:glycosyltransferase involved in cell wall biosynthesis